MNSKNILSLVLLSIWIIGFTSCSIDKKAKLAKLKAEHDKISYQIKALEDDISKSGTDTTYNKNIYKVSVSEITLKEFNHFIEVQGKVDGEDNVGVSAQMLGIVTKVYVKEGDFVQMGQVLADLDAQTMKSGIEELKSSLVFVTDIYNKQKSLWDQKIGTEIQYLTAKNNKESLENKLKTIEEQLKMSQIKSPINGTVEEITLKVGQAASPGFNFFRIVNFSKVKVTADVAEAYTSKVRKGNPVIVYFPDLNQEKKSQISFTSRFINPVNRTFMAEVRLTPDATEYRANMLAVIKIIDYAVDSAVVIPINLVRSENAEKFVFITKNEAGKVIAKKQIVEVGQSYNGQIEIKKGLNKGDQIVTIGYQNIIDGQEVKL